MGNCLFTKLKESVSNNSLLKIDEVKVTYKSPLVGATRNVRMSPDVQSITVRITDGTGSLEPNSTVTNITVQKGGTDDYGNGIFRFYSESSTAISIAFSEKFKLASALTGGSGASIKADDLLLLLQSGYLRHELQYNIIGYLDVASLPADAVLSTTDYWISGDELCGDLTPFLTAFTDVDSRFFINNHCTADFCQMPDVCKFLLGANEEMSWSNMNGRDNSFKIMSFVNPINFGSYLDNMLMNQANCVARTDVPFDYMWIQANGSHTLQEADWMSAINILKTKGYKLRINGTIYQ